MLAGWRSEALIVCVGLEGAAQRAHVLLGAFVDHCPVCWPFMSNKSAVRRSAAAILPDSSQLTLPVALKSAYSGMAVDDPSHEAGMFSNHFLCSEGTMQTSWPVETE